MNFDHYTDQPVTLAVDLVNTFWWESGNEHLASTEDLSRFLAEHDGDWIGSLPPVQPSDVEDVRRLRSELRRVFEAKDSGSAAGAVNEILAASGATPRLSAHEGTPHLHFEPLDDSLAHWLGVVTAMGLATVLADYGLDRLGICQSDTCADVFVDTSRNRSRRHCSTTCGTREHVAAHRQRKRHDA